MFTTLIQLIPREMNVSSYKLTKEHIISLRFPDGITTWLLSTGDKLALGPNCLLANVCRGSFSVGKAAGT
jgi:hypothetical protein